MSYEFDSVPVYFTFDSSSPSKRFNDGRENKFDKIERTILAHEQTINDLKMRLAKAKEDAKSPLNKLKNGHSKFLESNGFSNDGMFERFNQLYNLIRIRKNIRCSIVENPVDEFTLVIDGQQFSDDETKKINVLKYYFAAIKH